MQTWDKASSFGQVRARYTTEEEPTNPSHSARRVSIQSRPTRTPPIRGWHATAPPAVPGPHRVPRGAARVPTSETHRVSARKRKFSRVSSFLSGNHPADEGQGNTSRVEENWELIFSCPPWRRSRAGKKEKEAAEATHAIAASISSASSSSSSLSLSLSLLHQPIETGSKYQSIRQVCLGSRSRRCSCPER